MTDTVRSAARVLDLIELLSCEPQGLHLSAVAERLAMPKSSTLMLLRTLVTRHYALRTEGDRYVLSDDFRAGAFGWRAAPFANLIAVVQPVLRALADTLGESATFGILAAPGEARVLAKEVANVEVRWDSDISRSIPLYCTAVGRALLSGMAPVERARQIGATPLVAVTPQTVTAPEQILAIVEQAACQGFVVAGEEFALGGTGVATPIFDQSGELVGALNVSCVSSRMHEKWGRIVSELLGGAAEIARLIDGSVRPPAPVAAAAKG